MNTKPKVDVAGMPTLEPRADLAEAQARIEAKEKASVEQCAPGSVNKVLNPGIYILALRDDGKFTIDGELIERAIYPLCGRMQLTAFVEPRPGSPLEQVLHQFFPGMKPGDGPSPPVVNDKIVGVPTQEEHIVGGNREPSQG